MALNSFSQRIYCFNFRSFVYMRFSYSLTVAAFNWKRGKIFYILLDTFRLSGIKWLFLYNSFYRNVIEVLYRTSYNRTSSTSGYMVILHWRLNRKYGTTVFHTEDFVFGKNDSKYLSSMRVECACNQDGLLSMDFIVELSLLSNVSRNTLLYYLYPTFNNA